MQPTERETWMMYGDGDIMAIWDARPSYVTGEIEFELKPTAWTKYKNDIIDDMYDRETGTIIKRYPSDMCINLNPSPNCNKWLLLCNFHGKETDLIKKFDLKLLRENQNLRKENDTFRKILARLNYRIQKSLAQPDEFKVRTFHELQRLKDIVGVNQTLPPGQQQQQQGDDY